MRAIGQSDDVSVKAYAGTSGVILAFDVAEDKRAGLLGFAIERSGGNRPHKWLGGWPRVSRRRAQAGRRSWGATSAPIQKFRWSDYTVFPDTTYRYTVHPCTASRARCGSIRVRRSRSRRRASRAATTASCSTARPPRARRSRASSPRSRSSSRPRARRSASRSMPARALAWLSRGALEQITSFCSRALDPTWALDIAIYEYELQEIRDAIDAARHRGADVRIVYHAKPRDHQSELNEEHVAHWPESQKRARVTSRICHDKFIVLSRVSNEVRQPAAVLCGSTNFTHNGVYRQANVVHTADRPELARTYLDLFEVLFSGKTRGRDEEVDQREQRAVAGRRDRRGLLAAQGRGRPRPLRRRDQGRGARRPVLHGVRPQRADPRGAQGRPARLDPALRAAELARRDHGHPSRPHGRLRRDRDAQRGPRGLPQGVDGRPARQHPHPHEARRHRLHVRRADGHQRIAQPVRERVERQRRELPHHPRARSRSPTATASSSCASTTTTASAGTRARGRASPTTRRHRPRTRPGRPGRCVPTTAGRSRTSRRARSSASTASASACPVD